MDKNKKREEVKECFKKDDYILTSKEYVNNKTKLDYICPNGHEHSVTWSKWLMGRRCPCCAGNIKLTLSYICKEFIKEYYILLNTEYINNKTKLYFICPNGHEHYTMWSSWKKGFRCSYCSGNAKHTLVSAGVEFTKIGYVLLATEYINNKEHLDFLCDKGHKHSITLDNLLQGKRCAYCTGNIKKTREGINKYFINENYILVSTDYTKSNTKLNTICPNGHDYKVCWNNWQQGQRCPKCNNVGTSNFEKEVKQFIIEQGIEIIERVIKFSLGLRELPENTH